MNKNAANPIVYGVFGKGMLKNNHLLCGFLQAYADKAVQVKRLYPVVSSVDNVTAMLGWGRKKSFYRASQFAHRHQLAMLTLEDGFLRSLDSGKSSRHACSMVIDPIGIYFDARQPSYLEELSRTTQLTADQRKRAERLIDKILAERLSKYNGTAKVGTTDKLNIDPSVKNILLIDQVAGDQSIIGAGASKKSFAKMFKAAEQTHPNATLWVKAHPAGKLGYLTELELPKTINIIHDKVNPIELLEQMDEVYTVSSHMGFEALLLGKTVHCFGVPWYAGWGLTDDNHTPKKVYQQAKARRGQKDILTLFSACYLRYSRYVDPATGTACDIEQAINWLVTNRAWRDKLPAEIVVYEFSKWKYPFVRRFLKASGTQLSFKPKTNSMNPAQVFRQQVTNTVSPHVHNISELSKASSIANKLPLITETVDKVTELVPMLDLTQPHLVWGLAKKQEILASGEKSSNEIWCMEDGFIRSNGLGASLIEPLSVVIDKQGIYYDATSPSDLESILVTIENLSQTEQQRVESLINHLLIQQVSKYNVGEAKPLILTTTKRKILVVGQVEDDMSVKLCGSDIKTNLGLLQQVRADNPDAFILYKPHPDVQAGLRTGKISEADMVHYADQVVLDIRMPSCLAAVDEVHTISSLTGFEALLRGLSVTCYGLPFYAGWGLTHDKITDNATNSTAQATLSRRDRRNPLTLSQLVKGALIDYPLYQLPTGFGLAQVEQVIDFLYQQQPAQPTSPTDKFGYLREQAISQAKLQFMKTRQRVLKQLKR